MNIFSKLIIFGMVLLLAACGSRDSSEDVGAAPDDVTPPDVTGQSLTLTSSLESGELLAKRGSLTVTATVTDNDGQLVPDGTPVFFSATSGTITEVANTISGKATATYFSEGSDNTVTITASESSPGVIGGLTSDIIILIASGPAASIEILTITPERLGLSGTGFDAIGTVTFIVRDADGSRVQDGQVVSFTLEAPVGGAEFVSSSTAMTVNGEVSISLVSGTVPGVATITASIEFDSQTISTEARVTMGYGMPDQFHVGLASEFLNVPGLVRFGEENTLSAYIADRFSNPVPVNTPVYFASNCGIVALSDPAGVATNLTNQFGIASATAVTAQPTPPPNGVCTYIVWTEGEEAFTDSNANGRYDAGEDFFDLGEPYIDANSNGQFDTAEIYFDLDGNGQYTSGDSQWSGNTFVWTETNVRWSNNTAIPVVTPSTFTIAAGGQQSFIVTAADVNGLPLPGGTNISISTTCPSSEIMGETDVTLADALTAPTIFTFNLLSTDDTVGDISTCTVTVEVSAPINGTEQRVITGTID